MVRFGSKVVYPTDPEDVLGNVHLVGNAELAARLGSIVLMDRRGNVYWYDDFEAATLRWDTGGSGTGDAVALDASKAHLGENSCKLTTGNLTDNTATMSKYLASPPLTKLGFEFAIELNVNIKYYQLEVTIFDGTNGTSGVIRYDLVNEKLEYYDSVLGWTDVATSITGIQQDGTFHPMKLVIDYENTKYSRLLFDNASYDLSSYALTQSGNETAPCLHILYYIINKTDTSHSANVDNFILTYNEP